MHSIEISKAAAEQGSTHQTETSNIDDEFIALEIIARRNDCGGFFSSINA